MKHSENITFLIALSILFLATVVFFWLPKNLKSTTPRTPPKEVSVPENTAPESPITTPPNQSKYYYPISDYSNRLTVKSYGQYFNAANFPPVCGRAFIGYHNGDDLDITTEESDIEIPVLAIADGKIRQVSFVSGYGGLIIMESNLAGQDVTINYGHISLVSALVRPGDTVIAGQKIANLGVSCSTETDGERKHLHFAIHKGKAINVADYVNTQSELTNWLNPKQELATLGAK